jgi:hypothetical protein
MKAKTFFYANVFAVFKNVFLFTEMQSIVFRSYAFLLRKPLLLLLSAVVKFINPGKQAWQRVS